MKIYLINQVLECQVQIEQVLLCWYVQVQKLQVLMNEYKYQVQVKYITPGLVVVVVGVVVFHWCYNILKIPLSYDNSCI